MEKNHWNGSGSDSEMAASEKVTYRHCYMGNSYRRC